MRTIRTLSDKLRYITKLNQNEKFTRIWKDENLLNRFNKLGIISDNQKNIILLFKEVLENKYPNCFDITLIYDYNYDIDKEFLSYINIEILHETVVITNQYDIEHTINNLVTKLEIKKKYNECNSNYVYIEYLDIDLFGKRMTLSDVELKYGYMHSHLSTNRPNQYDTFCLGSTGTNNAIFMSLESLKKDIDIHKINLFLYTLKSFISYESYEGGAYKYIAEVLNNGYSKKTQHELLTDNQLSESGVINRLEINLFRRLINKKVDYPTLGSFNDITLEVNNDNDKYNKKAILNDLITVYYNDVSNDDEFLYSENEVSFKLNKQFNYKYINKNYIVVEDEQYHEFINNLISLINRYGDSNIKSCIYYTDGIFYHLKKMDVVVNDITIGMIENNEINLNGRIIPLEIIASNIELPIYEPNTIHPKIKEYLTKKINQKINEKRIKKNIISF